MQLSAMIIMGAVFCFSSIQSAPFPQYPFYNNFPSYYNPYGGNYGYNVPYYMPNYNQNPYLYQPNLSNQNQVGDAHIIDVDNTNSAGNDQMQSWLKHYQQNIQQYNQEQLNNQAKQNQIQLEEQRKQMEEAARQAQQQTLDIGTVNPNEDVIKLAAGSGYILKQNTQSFHETITSKPIMHSYTESKPIISHIHRVFTSDGSKPLIKVFYNGKDITDDQDAIDVMRNKNPTTESNVLKPGLVAATTEENSDASAEDNDDNSPPKSITSWIG